MATNQYFQDNYQSVEDQQLIDALVIEAIQCKGQDMKYLSKEHNSFDFLFGEDPNASFTDCTVIEMYCAEVSGFGGDGEMFSKFGLEVRDTSTFVVSKTRFAEEFPTYIRPREGDLLFHPVTNAILEIKFVNPESPFFQKGKQFVWELKVETFEISHEEFITGDAPIDDMINGILNFDSATETEPFGDNLQIATRVDPVVTFDPADPFAVE